eukprot:1579896-Rhodomonas_salina.2
MPELKRQTAVLILTLNYEPGQHRTALGQDERLPARRSHSWCRCRPSVVVPGSRIASLSTAHRILDTKDTCLNTEHRIPDA